MTSLAIINRDQIIARMRKGDRLADIAKDLGFSSHASISMRLKDDPEYQAARIDSLDARMNMREDELECADDSVTLARARELLSHARWRAEREAPHIWGAKHDAGGSGVVINIARDGVTIQPDRPAIDTTYSVASESDTPE